MGPGHARSRGFITTLLLLFFAASLTPSVHARDEDFFPFSVWYSGGKARAPMLEPIDESSRERWLRDLQQIRALGFNTVRTWVEWTANEPRPGEYDFQNLKLLAELAQSVGLKFFVQVYTDSAPDWVAEQWQDARFVAQSGDVIPSQSAPGYCFDHPEVRQKVLAFYRAAAEVANQYQNFVGWDLWSEPHIINWAIIDYIPNAQFCYCPSSMARFRVWLRQKYGTLDSLNESWYRTFAGWNQVEPPRFGTILSYVDFIDWKLYIREKLAEDLRMRSDTVKGVNSSRVTTSHAAVPALFTSPLSGLGVPDDWLMAEVVDYFGTSIYPKHSFPDRHWSRLTLTSLMDFIRSSGRANGGFYVGELQGGMGIRGTVVGDPVTAVDQRLWALGMLSRGARAINVYAYYPMNSGYEAGGYGLINLDGSVTPRAEALGRLAGVVDRHQQLFLSSTPRAAQVAIVYNPLSYLVGGEQHSGRGNMVRDSLQGLHQLFWKQNIAADFVHLREVEQGLLENYRVAFLPYPLMLTEDSAGRLRDYVRAGGTLVAEARCGWNDDRGYSQEVIPGFGLDEVFGVREGRLKMQKTVELALDPSMADRVPGVERILGAELSEELLPRPGTRILARLAGGEAAMTSATFGEGRAIMIGTFLSAAMVSGDSESRIPSSAAEEVLLSLVQSAGVERVLEVADIGGREAVEVRVLDRDGGMLVFFFNHSDEEVTPAPEGLSRGVDLETGREVDLSSLVMAPGEIRLFDLEHIAVP